MQIVSQISVPLLGVPIENNTAPGDYKINFKMFGSNDVLFKCRNATLVNWAYTHGIENTHNHSIYNFV